MKEVFTERPVETQQANLPPKATYTQESKKITDAMTKAANDSSLDDKAKIEAIAAIYFEQLIPLYERSHEEMQQLAANNVANSCIMDQHEERYRASEMLLEKYTMLSKEYQSQAKEFKLKHELIKGEEEEKRK